MPNDATKVRVVLELVLQTWRSTPLRDRLIEAKAAVDRMENLICTLLAEREFGPQPYACTDPSCSVVTVGTGYGTCPSCGGALKEVQT